MPFRTKRALEIDERALSPLLEQSQDLHADSMVMTRDSLDEMVEIGNERRADNSIEQEETQAFRVH